MTTHPIVTVYTTKTCAYCPSVKEFLRSKEVEFREVDVSDDVKPIKIPAKYSGAYTVPQTMFEHDDGTIVVIGPAWGRLMKEIARL